MKHLNILQPRAMHLGRHSTHLFSLSEALQKAFIPFSTVSSPFYRHQYRHCPNAFLLPKVRHYRWVREKPKATARSRRRDEDIDAWQVHLVAPDSGALLPLESPLDILGRIDRKTHFLVEVAPATDTTSAICRIIPKQEVFAHEQLKSKVVKPKAAKQLGLTWVTDPKDLRHKLDRMKILLDQGRRVELVIAENKMRKRRELTKEDRDKLVAGIRALTRDFNGVREWRELEEQIVWQDVVTQTDANTEMVEKKPKYVTVKLYFENTKTAQRQTKGSDVEADPATEKSDQ